MTDLSDAVTIASIVLFQGRKMIKKRPTVNYLNNRDLMLEIHRSKTSYSKFIDDCYKDYDLIVSEIPDNSSGEPDYSTLPITLEDIATARQNRAARHQREAFNRSLLSFTKGVKPKESEFKVDPTSYSNNELVFRVHTYEHIPKDDDRKKTKRTYSDLFIKLNFIPFKHFILSDESNYDRKVSLADVTLYFKEVGRSHTNKNGEFSLNSGAITNKLATMYLLLVEKYASKANWRGYSYVDEMQGAALLQLTYAGLQFNEMKSDNPFSYLTSFISNSFTRILNSEKQNQILRDDLLISSGHDPSWTAQFEHEESIRKGREEKLHDE